MCALRGRIHRNQAVESQETRQIDVGRCPPWRRRGWSVCCGVFVVFSRYWVKGSSLLETGKPPTQLNCSHSLCVCCLDWIASGSNLTVGNGSLAVCRLSERYSIMVAPMMPSTRFESFPLRQGQGQTMLLLILHLLRSVVRRDLRFSAVFLLHGMKMIKMDTTSSRSELFGSKM